MLVVTLGDMVADVANFSVLLGVTICTFMVALALITPTLTLTLTLTRPASMHGPHACVLTGCKPPPLLSTPSSRLPAPSATVDAALRLAPWPAPCAGARASGCEQGAPRRCRRVRAGGAHPNPNPNPYLNPNPNPNPVQGQADLTLTLTLCRGRPT